MNETTNDGYYYDVEEINRYYLWEDVASYLRKIFTVLYILSFCGNILTVVIMVSASRRERSPISVRILFGSLALSDSIIMVIYFIMDNIPYGHISVLRNFIDCYTYTFKHISNSILAMITVERVICVGMPLHARRLSSPKRIVTTLVIVVLGLIIFDTVNYFCFYDFYWAAYYPIDLYRGFVPQFVIITAGSIFIIAELTCLRTIGHRSKEATRLLIAANVTFVVTLLPLRLYNYISDTYVFWCPLDMIDALFIVCRSLTWLEALNAMVNFYLYVLCGRKFRAEILSLFRCKPLRIESVQNTSSTRSANESNS